MVNESNKSLTHEIIKLLSRIEGEKLDRELMIDDLSANNESQKTQITIMRHRNEANEYVIDRTVLAMVASILINFITIGWIVFSAF